MSREGELLAALPAAERALLEDAPAGEGYAVCPMPAVLSDRREFDEGWIFERKLDGVRALGVREPEGTRLLSRTGRDVSSSYPEIVDALGGQRCRDFTVDGEAPPGARLSQAAALHPHRNHGGARELGEACARGWEGLIAKRAAGRYLPRRSSDWLKLKCAQGQELVIGGFTEPAGSRIGFGALLIGYYADDALRYAGKVGTGFDQRTLRRLRALLDARACERSPFDGPVRERGAHWVRPELVAQIGLTEWTRDGMLRHPRFLGLRDDKRPEDVVRERPDRG